MEKKKTLGRRKLKMETITDFNARRVAYSRRKRGLFKKASELSVLCGIDIAIVTFSLGGNAFSFGHPSVDSVIDRFLNQSQDPNDQTLELDTSEPAARVHELDQQLIELRNRLEAEKKRGETLRKMSKSWEAYINELGLHELEQLKRSMEELKKDVSQRANELMTKASSSSLLLDENHVREADEAVDGKTETDTSTIPHDWLRL